MKKLSILLLSIALFTALLLSCKTEPDPELTAPEVTLLLSETSPQTTVIINWTKSRDAESYVIYRTFTRDGVTEENYICETDASVFSFEDDTCESGDSYTYTVTACAERPNWFSYVYFSEESEPKTITTAKNPLQTLDYPTNFTVQKAEDNTNALTLKWDAVEGADTYEIYSCREYSLETELLTATKETSHTIYHLRNEKNYSFKIKAVNGENYSLLSAKKTGRVAVAENIIKSQAYVLENGVTEHFYSSNDTLWFKCTPQKGIITIVDTDTDELKDISATVFTEDGKISATGLTFTLTESSGYKNAQVAFNDSIDFCLGSTYFISITHYTYGTISICVE